MYAKPVQGAYQGDHAFQGWQEHVNTNKTHILCGFPAILKSVAVRCQNKHRQLARPFKRQNIDE